MPTYEYHCEPCGIAYEEIKPIKDYDGKDKCPLCLKQGYRVFTPIVFHGEKVQHAEFNPAFGKVIQNKYHRDEMAKRHNMVEIGNEKPSTIHNYFDKGREEKRRKSWDDV